MFNSSMGEAILYMACVQQPAVGPAAALGRAPPIPPTLQNPVGVGTQPDSCGQNAARHYITGASNGATREGVAKAAGHARIRWIRPGDVVTQDYRPDRLNVIIDADGQIMTARCG